MSQYMTILVLSLSVPLVLSFWPPLGFYRHLRALLKVLLMELFIFGGWDVFAVWRGHWAFNAPGVGSARIINLPLEEVLFFLVIPFCCLFTWEALKFISRRLR